jgi:hypothetical protein
MRPRETEPTLIGRVRQVVGARITAELDDELAGVSPVFRGSIQSVGQIGSIVRIPQGMVDLVATVVSIGIAELVGVQDNPLARQLGQRWLQLQLIGEIDRGTGLFTRGVANYPALNDPVHFTRSEDIAAILPRSDMSCVEIGRLSTARDVPVSIDLGRLVLRHSAIVGSTGSGKTSAVASLLQRVAGAGWEAANIVVIDSHGEYATAFESEASVRSVLGVGESALPVPFWALPASDILRAFTGMTVGPTTVKTFANIVESERRAFVSGCNWLELEPLAVTADTPVPFDLRRAWLRLDDENRETRHDKADPLSACIVTPGDAPSLRPTVFEPNGAGSRPPHQAPTYGSHGTIPEALRLGLMDPRLAFLRGDGIDSEAPHDRLADSIRLWLGGSKSISVLDFSGVSSTIAELAIGLVMKLIFETATRSMPGESSIGRSGPVLIVLEEAHRYLGEGSLPTARDAANQIAREGRKYGVGIMLVSQRPSELPDTALSQCGTLIALRLSNSADQGKVKSALPDSLADLSDSLSSLRVGEAIISGEATQLPVRVLLHAPFPAPRADDPSIQAWRGEAQDPSVDLALNRWRGIYNK